MTTQTIHSPENTTASTLVLGNVVRNRIAMLASRRRVVCAIVALMIMTFGNRFAEGRIIINEVNMGSQDYFEIYNYSINPIDMTGYTAEFWDSGLGGLNPLPVIDFPSLAIAANSVLTFHENADVAAGEIDTPAQYMWHARDLSIVIRDANGDIVDLWAHGNNFFGPPDADPNTTPINTINSNTNNTTYQRYVVQNGDAFSTTDWGAAAQTRNDFNIAQVVAVPEPATWAMMLIGLGMLAGTGYMQRQQIEDPVAE